MSRAGIRARTINSANLHEWQEIQAEGAEGVVDVLLISPERLNNPDVPISAARSVEAISVFGARTP
ncbi:MAG: hypothetical protein HOW97_18900 [Catenulispora sp.]|nr:hypothetical protein [Catenulispora sp.]